MKQDGGSCVLVLSSLMDQIPLQTIPGVGSGTQDLVLSSWEGKCTIASIVDDLSPRDEQLVQSISDPIHLHLH